MKDKTLHGRLLSVAGFVRQGAVFADVGTDHAHLPIFLLKSGRISHAICSDINKGPLSLARANVASEGLADSVDFVLTDGASELKPYKATDYAICGMGGELIADIIARAPHLKDPEINLILQPMSKQSALRAFLADQGFSIVDELYSTDEGKHYLSLLANYTGETKKLTVERAEIGLENIKNVNLSSQISYFKVKIIALRKKIEGLEKAGIDPSGDIKMLSAMLERVAKLELLEACGKEKL